MYVYTNIHDLNYQCINYNPLEIYYFTAGLQVEISSSNEAKVSELRISFGKEVQILAP